MFILPPPPKSSAYYPTGLGYRDGAVLEATNSVTHLDSSSIQTFTAPEGVYPPRECIFLATPLPHPSDPPPAVVNPLAPTHTQPSTHSSGTRLTTVSLQDARTNSMTPVGPPQKRGTRQMSTASNKSFGGWSIFNSNNNNNKKDDDMAVPSEEVLSTSAPLPSSFGNPLQRKDTTTSVMTDSGSSISGSNSNNKKKKPKNSLSKNNSSFISRTVLHDSMHKRIAERSPNETFFWANIGRSMSWIDLSQASKQCRQEPLMKILFTKSHPLCHDVNHLTKSMTNMDIVIGTSAGDVLWIECMSARYNRINKNGDVTRSAVTDIKWIPDSENLFMTAHADGSICVFDKDREDGGFSAQGMTKGQDPKSTDVFRVIRSLDAPPLNHNYYNPNSKQNATGPLNPVAMYKVSNSSVTSMKFSPVDQMLAITSKDGYLRFLDLTTEHLTDIMPSYYGGFLCANYSSDGKYLATGGQDDMVCIWAVETAKLVVRLQGHTSWVRAVEFDPYVTDEVSYRLGSVGDDGKLLLWDFAPKSLNRPKMAAAVSNSKQHKRSSSVATAAGAEEVVEQPGEANARSSKTKLHPFVSQKETPILPPVVTKLLHLEKMDGDSLSDLRFMENEVLVSGRDGRVWYFDRPSSF